MGAVGNMDGEQPKLNWSEGRKYSYEEIMKQANLQFNTIQSGEQQKLPAALDNNLDCDQIIIEVYKFPDHCSKLRRLSQ